MSDCKLLVTHAKDAARYVNCGWTLTGSKVVELKGLKKKYMECTLEWRNLDRDPIYPPKEDYPEIEFTDMPMFYFL